MDFPKVISEIKATKRQSNVLVVFKDKTTLSIPLDVAMKYSLRKFQSIEESLYNSILKDIRIIEIKKIAYNYASKNIKSQKQIVNYLKRKSFTPPEIDVAINFLNEFNLIDDKKYAEQAVEYFTHRRNYGQFRIKMELQSRGISRDIIQQVFQKYFQEELTEEQIAKNLIEKKMNLIMRKDQSKRLNYVYNLMNRNGISSNIASKIVKLYDFQVDNTESENLPE